MTQITRSYLAAISSRGIWRIAGRELRPFCLEYFERLTAIDSPLIKSGEPVSMQDIYLAAWICSRRPGAEFSIPGGLWHRIRFAGVSAAYNLEAENRKFEMYLSDHYTTPRLWQAEGEGEPLASPWTLALESRLMEYTNLTRLEIRSMSLGLVIWHALAIGERKGGARPMSEIEIELAERLKNDV